MLARVTSPHFCAGIVLDGNVVVAAAPILKWTVGKQREWLSDYFRNKDWKAIVICQE